MGRADTTQLRHCTAQIAGWDAIARIVAPPECTPNPIKPEHNQASTVDTRVGINRDHPCLTVVDTTPSEIVAAVAGIILGIISSLVELFSDSNVARALAHTFSPSSSSSSSSEGDADDGPNAASGAAGVEVGGADAGQPMPATASTTPPIIPPTWAVAPANCCWVASTTWS